VSLRLDIVSAPNPIDRVGTMRTWRFHELFVVQFAVSAAIIRNVPQLAESHNLTSVHVFRAINVPYILGKIFIRVV
jgi:hypothetical protein